MINPNAKSNMYGVVTKLSRDSYDKSLTVTVRLINGQEINELGFVYHRTLKVGDFVSVTIGFSIMSDRYGIERIRKVNKNYRPSGKLIRLMNDQAYRNGYRFEYFELSNVFCINGQRLNIGSALMKVTA